MIKPYRLQNGKLVAAERSEAQIVVLVNPGQEEINYLIKKYQLDEHTLSSAFDSDELARLEYEDEHTAIIYKRPKNYSAADHFQFRVSSSGVFLFDNLVIVISDGELPLTDERKFSKIASLKMFALKLLNFSVTHFNEHLRIINRMSDELEQRLIYDNSHDEYLTVFGLSKSLVYYINAISSNETLLKKLQMNRSIGFNEIEQELLDDIIIENAQCRRQAEIYSNILSSMMSAHESIVSNDLNYLVKTLNVVTIGIMVPTFVVSAMSMNVAYPFDAESPHVIWFILLAVILSTLGFMWVQKKKKW
ncbi:magnesium transporter [Fibrobacterales bacterium]|nr:magnesium transporter [Fibrobacterales bacterium]